MEWAVLLLFTYLIVKHFICDFPISIQTPWMFLNKGTYGHPGGLAHAGVHVLGSLPATFFMSMWVGYGFPWMLSLMAFEFLVHYHMDWFKMWLGKRKKWHPKTPQFWTMLGIDQLVHYLTYVVMIGAWLWKF